tara:strand:- start:74 stop:730 length:657 start_codon:yes stop_codon:yes gene_type:complete
MNSVIILAGGIGSRFKSSIPKQFLNLNDKQTVLSFVVNQFIKNQLVNEIIIVVSKPWLKKIQNEFKNLKVIVGGGNRSQSSFNGLKACSSKCINVLIHDAARPLVSQEIINNSINELSNYDAVIPTLDVPDSLICNKDGENKYLDRQIIKLVQTPQSFKYNKIFLAYNNHTNELDDYSVLVKNKVIDVKSKFIKGSKFNFKITTKNDIKFARKLVYEL